LGWLLRLAWLDLCLRIGRLGRRLRLAENDYRRQQGGQNQQ
jgi:hypothetical protein